MSAFICFCSDNMSIEINFQHSSNAKGIKALLLLSSFSIRCTLFFIAPQLAEIWNLFKIESTGIKKLATLLEKHFLHKNTSKLHLLSLFTSYPFPKEWQFCILLTLRLQSCSKLSWQLWKLSTLFEKRFIAQKYTKTTYQSLFTSYSFFH